MALQTRVACGDSSDGRTVELGRTASFTVLGVSRPQGSIIWRADSSCGPQYGKTDSNTSVSGHEGQFRTTRRRVVGLCFAPAAVVGRSTICWTGTSCRQRGAGPRGGVWWVHRVAVAITQCGDLGDERQLGGGANAELKSGCVEHRVELVGASRVGSLTSGGLTRWWKRVTCGGLSDSLDSRARVVPRPYQCRAGRDHTG